MQFFARKWSQQGRIEKERKEVLKQAKATNDKALIDFVKANRTPESYLTIWEDDKKYVNTFEKAKALLQDYTKNDSLLSRWVNLHFFRHYVKDVNEKLKKAQDIDSLIAAINEIEIAEKNKGGSLERRRQFINRMCQVNNPDERKDSLDF